MAKRFREQRQYTLASDMYAVVVLLGRGCWSSLELP
jgi:hypothetical protein